MLRFWQNSGSQNCDNKEKPIVVVTPGKKEQRRQLVCFCTYYWSFTNKHHSKDANMDISFFKQFNPSTGKFHRALPYAEDEHPRRIRGPVTDHELDQFRKDRLQLRKPGGPDKSTNELFRSITGEELAVVREWADRVLKDAQSASSTLTDEVLNCSIRLLHKGGETSNKPSDGRPPPQQTYHQRPVKVFTATESCRHLGFWTTPNGNMAATKQRVLVRTKEVLGLLTHHPLETKVAKELFQSMAISVFRFSAAQV
jgi:hypothetical protein